MNKSQLKSSLLTATVATGAGVAVLLFGKWIPWIAPFDSACIQSSADTENQIYDTDPGSNTILVRTLLPQPDKGRDIQIIQVTDDPGQIFEQCPPSPLDYAIILESLKNRGYRHVVLATRMTWDQEPGLEAEGLGSRLARFDRSVIAIPVTRGATAQPIPAALQRALIRDDQVHGSHQLIPIVNQVALPAHTDGGVNTLAGFQRIESAPAPAGNTPLLAYWEGEGLIPSLDLLTVMAAHDTRPADLVIHCGQSIRLGKNGPVIPLDDYGQTRTPTTPVTTSLPPLKIDDLITQQPSTPMSSQSQLCVIHAVGEKTSTTNVLPDDRLTSLLALSKNSLVPGNATRLHRLPLAASIVILVDIALLACWFAGFSRWSRHLAFALTASFLFPLLLALIDLTQHWFGLSAPLATLIVAWLWPPPCHHRKQTSPMNHYRTTDPKPSLRV
ncbi:MAG: hypothetical protein H7A51_16315 [Akkermansiaceae bacterium]|nr:hypothetical protein [Akkermansiaceae bacterium]